VRPLVQVAAQLLKQVVAVLLVALALLLLVLLLDAAVSDFGLFWRQIYLRRGRDVSAFNLTDRGFLDGMKIGDARKEGAPESYCR
jgi:hypothetical protein